MSLIDGPLMSLKTAHVTLAWGYRHVNFRELYEFVDAGLNGIVLREFPDRFKIEDGIIKLTRGGEISYDKKPQEVTAAEELGYREYKNRLINTRILQHAVDGILEVTSDIMTFKKSYDAGVQYVSHQKKQSRRMQSLAWLFVVCVLFGACFLVKKTLEDQPSAYRKGVFVSVIMCMVVVVVFLMTAGILMLKQRVNSLQSMSLDLLKKLDYELGESIWILYSDAYQRGDIKDFKKAIAKKKMTAMQAQEESGLDCPANSKSSTRSWRNDDCIDPCKGTSGFRSDFIKAVEDAWINQTDRPACDQAIIILLRAFADLQDGTSLDLLDQTGMWMLIDRSVDRLRGMMYRYRDVSTTGTLDKTTAPIVVDIVKNMVVPAMKLSVVESNDLLPMFDPFFNTTVTRDVTIRTKAKCWERCLEDPDCLWAFFSPTHGAIFATKCTPTSVGCVDVTDTRACEMKYVRPIDMQENYPNRSWTMLVKDTNASKTYVRSNGMGVGLSAPVHGRLRLIAQNLDAEKTDQCKLISWTSTYETAKQWESWDLRAPLDLSLAPPSLIAKMTTSYRDAFSSPYAQKDTLWYYKVSGSDLFAANKGNSAVTFHALDSYFVRHLVDLLSKQMPDIRLEDYTDYIHGELEQYYLPANYPAIRPFVETVLRKVDTALRGDTSENTRDFITRNRFQEKMLAMSLPDIMDFVTQNITLASAMSGYIRNFPLSKQSKTLSVLRNAATTMIYMGMVGMIMYVWNRIICYRQDSCKLDSVIRGITICCCLMLFSICFSSASLKRYHGSIAYNRDMIKGNSTKLSTSTKSLLNDSTKYIRALVQTMSKDDGAVLRQWLLSLKLMYRKAGYRRGELETNNELEQSSSFVDISRADEEEDMDARLLLSRIYVSTKDIINTYDQCNIVGLNRRTMPYPSLELTTYMIVCFIVVVLAIYATRKLDPLQKINNVRLLLSLRRDLTLGIPPPPEFSHLVLCCKTPDGMWSVTINLCVVFLVFLTLFICGVVVMSSSDHKMNLYASGLYAKRECVSKSI